MCKKMFLRLTGWRVGVVVEVWFQKVHYMCILWFESDNVGYEILFLKSLGRP